MQFCAQSDLSIFPLLVDFHFAVMDQIFSRILIIPGLKGFAHFRPTNLPLLLTDLYSLCVLFVGIGVEKGASGARIRKQLLRLQVVIRLVHGQI